MSLVGNSFGGALARKLAATTRNGSTASFGECGHWVQIERQDEFASLLTSFLKTDRT
jgi:pimeloyl-ACP methyl ester carboxylesterase